MFYLIMLLACFIANPLSLAADTIGRIEYQLPPEDKNWQKIEELEGNSRTKSLTTIYVPQGTTKETAKEFFATHSNNRPLDGTDQASLEKSLQKVFPGKQVRANILEANPQSILFEWWVKENGQEKIHGWTRTFLGTQGTTMLSYQTQEINTVDKARPVWLQTLRDAKVAK